MATDLTIEETSTWSETVKLIDTDEPVIGGAEGTSNQQAIQLSSRTQWLKTQIANVIAGADIEADDEVLTQLLAAIQALIAGAVGLPADIPFYAGFGSDGAGKDLAVQAYGRVVLPRDVTITGGIGHLITAATDADLILDIELNGSTIYTTRPQFDAASTTFEAGVIDGADDEIVIDADAGDVLEFFVDQIGSTIAGQGLTFTLAAVTR